MVESAARGPWEALFWAAVLVVLYTYAGYPLLLLLIAKRNRPTTKDLPYEPSVTLLVPVHNERANIEAKLQNTLSIAYPRALLDIVFVSDGSDDGTAEYLREHADDRVILVTLPVRRGKAAALNAGLERARGEIVVFTDASILLEADAVREIVAPFASTAIGCVSGEDHVPAFEGEGLYGRYELFLRRQESRVGSIVGASGSLYAQRRTLCEPFRSGLAPDFWSVLRTVIRGYRAVVAPAARGEMRAVQRVADEFERKVRTLLRGMTTLGICARLLNPLRFGWFALSLWSHKLLRWAVPFMLIAVFVSSTVLAFKSRAYLVLFAVQMLFYTVAAWPRAATRVGVPAVAVKIAVYFTVVNAAALIAWGKYCAGVRQEVWAPSKR